MPRKKQITVEATYHGKPIMTDKAKQQGCCEPILARIEEQFEDMTKRHNKVLFMRYDTRFPSDFPPVHDNQTFYRFQADFIKHLKRQGFDPHYVTVREQSREKHQHYHGILLLDGNKTQNIHGHIADAEAIWRRKLNIPPGRGLIDDCSTSRDGSPQQNGIMLRRDDPDYQTKINQSFHWATYLAKENQKSSTPQGLRELFASRIKKKREE